MDNNSGQASHDDDYDVIRRMVPFAERQEEHLLMEAKKNGNYYGAAFYYSVLEHRDKFEALVNVRDNMTSSSYYEYSILALQYAPSPRSATVLLRNLAENKHLLSCMSLAKYFLAEKSFDCALEVANIATDIDPSFTGVYQLLARYWLSRGCPTKALGMVGAALCRNGGQLDIVRLGQQILACDASAVMPSLNLRPVPIFYDIDYYITSFNGASVLDGAVHSLLSQYYPIQRLIIIDDGSTDRTSDLAASLEAADVFRHRENRGIPAGRNTAMRVATANWAGSISDDVVLEDDYLAYLCSELELAESETVGIGGAMREAVVDFFAGSNQFSSTENLWRRYFLAFAYASRRTR